MGWEILLLLQVLVLGFLSTRTICTHLYVDALWQMLMLRFGPELRTYIEDVEQNMWSEVQE